MANSAASLTNVSKAFSGNPAVDDVSLSVPAGSVFGVIGRNGAGKSTSLRILLGIVTPDSGSASVLNGQDPRQAKGQLGYLPEERGLYRKMRVLDVAMYFGRLKGMNRSDARHRAKTLLDRFELAEQSSSKVETLSKGMAQKLQLICTLIHQPELLVLDEPFSGLDPVNINLVQTVIHEHRTAGSTVILSTHIMDQAERLCDEVVLIDAGKVQLAGSIDAVTAATEPRLRVVFDGPAADWSTLPGVAESRLQGTGEVELTLTQSADIQALIRHLNESISLREFTIARQSLQNVFLAQTDRRL
ncbi:MAG: ATP-binding cassette domain-containing protein [Pseudomonadaceae bacterium]|nr:ATP-binding cassette domain-containing protein [Pseudomonadaceae bacterium]